MSDVWIVKPSGQMKGPCKESEVHLYLEEGDTTTPVTQTGQSYEERRSEFKAELEQALRIQQLKR